MSADKTEPLHCQKSMSMENCDLSISSSQQRVDTTFEVQSETWVTKIGINVIFLIFCFNIIFHRYFIICISTMGEGWMGG